MLEVDAGGAQEAVAVEVGADADLHALQALLQQHAAGWGAAQLEQHVGTFPVVADEGGAGVVVVLQDVAAGVGAEPGGGLGRAGEGQAFGDLQPGVAQDGLAEGAVVLQPVAQGAAADHLVAVRPQGVLLLAASDLLEDHQPVAAHPVQRRTPLGHRLHQAAEAAGIGGVPGMNADLMALAAQRHVQVAQVDPVAYAQHPHAMPSTP